MHLMGTIYSCRFSAVVRISGSRTVYVGLTQNVLQWLCSVELNYVFNGFKKTGLYSIEYHQPQQTVVPSAHDEW